ncbi:MAG: ABC transporter ATP-binding protein [Oscillospiraceae bacterium]|nr:ABC transporter ATP-binding protein [Oscillospiraceae bacterium]
MAIEVKNLSFAYHSNAVLHDVSLAVEDGQFLALLGPNGAGKSTLFRCVLGLSRDYAGLVLCDGMDIAQLRPAARARRMAYIPQSAPVAFNHTVFETVLMGTACQGGAFSVPGKKQAEMAEYAIDKLGITALHDRGCQALSGGEAQLVAIARALAQGAKTLVMDEPAVSLDLGNKHRVLTLTHTLSREGYTILMSLHDPEQALLFADRAVMLCKGRIVADGRADEVITGDLIRAVYGVDVTVKTGEDGGKGILYTPPS